MMLMTKQFTYTLPQVSDDFLPFWDGYRLLRLTLVLVLILVVLLTGTARTSIFWLTICVIKPLISIFLSL
jgi:hypothetical protein